MDSVTLGNFRCFREPHSARIAPLTLLVGENSTGKTSFLALIRALWDVACRQRIPDFKEKLYGLDSFDDIVHSSGGSGGRPETFEAGFDFTLSIPDEPIMGVGPYRFEVVFKKKGFASLPVSRRIADVDKNVWVEECLEGRHRNLFHFGTSQGVWKRSFDLIRVGGVFGRRLARVIRLSFEESLAAHEKRKRGVSRSDYLRRSCTARGRRLEADQGNRPIRTGKILLGRPAPPFVPTPTGPMIPHARLGIRKAILSPCISPTRIFRIGEDGTP